MNSHTLIQGYARGISAIEAGRTAAEHAFANDRPLCGAVSRMGFQTLQPKPRPAYTCSKCAAIIESRIIGGMARAFFASAWADAHDESGRSFAPGTEITDAMPRTIDPAALHAAKTLAFDMVHANAGEWLRNIYAQHPAGWTLELWGHYAAMESMGHGVGLSDNEPCDAIVPYVEFGSHSLSRDYFEEVTA